MRLTITDIHGSFSFKHSNRGSLSLVNKVTHPVEGSEVNSASVQQEKGHYVGYLRTA